MLKENCPSCGVSWDGGSILESFIKQREEGSEWCAGKTDEQIESFIKEFYLEPYRWNRCIGIDLERNHPQHRDGISYWKCPDCNALFNRDWKEVDKNVLD